MMKKNVKNTLLGLTLTFLSTVGYAQSVQDVNGKVYKAKNQSNLTGTPLLFPNYLSGEIKFQDNNDVKGLSLNFDALDNLLLYKDKAGDAKEVAEQVKSFTVNETKNGKEIKRSFLAVGTNKEKAVFYEVLYQNGFSVLKRVTKYIDQGSNYNAASGEAEIKEKTAYFKYADGKLTSVSKNQKAFLGLFPENQEILKAFITLRKLNLNQDEDIASFFTNADETITGNKNPTKE